MPEISRRAAGIHSIIHAFFEEISWDLELDVLERIRNGTGVFGVKLLGIRGDTTFQYIFIVQS